MPRVSAPDLKFELNLELARRETHDVVCSVPSEKQRPVESPVELKDPPYRVTVYDNSTNTYEEVTAVLQLATGCTEDEAFIEAWEIDHFGQCVVHRATEGECLDVAKIISKIGIRVEVQCDLDV